MLDKINLGTLWTMLAGTVLAVLYMFNTFAKATEVDQKMSEITLQIAYGQYYDRLDDFDDAVDEGREELAQEYARQMERIRAKICKLDPEWERC